MVYPFGRWHSAENQTGDWCRWCKLFCTGTSVYRYRCTGLQTGWFKLCHSHCTTSSTRCTSDFFRNGAFGIFTNGEFKTKSNRAIGSLLSGLSPDDYAEEYAALSDAEFTQLLTRESHHMLGEVLEATPRATFHSKHVLHSNMLKRAWL